MTIAKYFHDRGFSTWISVLPPSSRQMASWMLSWKIFSFLLLVMRSVKSLVPPSLSRRHCNAATASQSLSPSTPSHTQTPPFHTKCMQVHKERFLLVQLHYQSKVGTLDCVIFLNSIHFSFVCILSLIFKSKFKVYTSCKLYIYIYIKI